MAKICTEQSYPSQRSAFTPEPTIEWIERGERSEDMPQTYIDKSINILHLEQFSLQLNHLSPNILFVLYLSLLQRSATPWTNGQVI